MSTALATAPSKPSALAVMASRFSCEPSKLLNTLKSTVFKNASDDELLALVIVSNEYGLNPLTKEIYAFPAKGGGIVPVVSVDGWANLANSHPQFDGLEFEWDHDSEGRLVACTCVIHRKDRSRPVKVTEYLGECRRNTEPWKMEHRMLRHKALSQCVRIAFGFGGIHDEDEAEVIGERVATGRVVETAPVVSRIAAAAPATSEPELPINQAQPSEEPVSIYDQLSQFMDRDKVTFAELVALATASKMTKGETNELHDLPPKAATYMVNNWPGALEWIAKDRKAKGGAQ